MSRVRNKRKYDHSEVYLPLDGISDDQFIKLRNKWFEKGGYEQLQINKIKVCTEYATYPVDDLLSYCIQQYFELPLDKQRKIYSDQKIEEWVTYVMGIQSKSNSSGFYLLHRRPLLRERSFEITGDKTTHKDKEIGEELEGKMKCVKYYYDNHAKDIDKWLIQRKVFWDLNLVQISEEEGLSYKDLNNHWTSIRSAIRKYCKDC